MMMWKEKEKEKMGAAGREIKDVKREVKDGKDSKTADKSSPVKKTKETEPSKSPRMKKAPVEQVIVSSTITVPVKVEIPYHLQEKNKMALRTDESFLIHKYSYADHK
jgi:hypothetical protein